MSHKTNENQPNIIVKSGKFKSGTIAYFENILEVEGAIDFSKINLTTRQIDIIAIKFSNFTDGRGFSLAKLIRANGFKGVLRAKGNIMSEQYPLAIRCGFDEIEISQAHAIRQPEKQWSETFKRVNNTYLDRLTA